MASQRKNRLSEPKPAGMSDNVNVFFKGKKSACLGKRLLMSTGKAAWIAGTTFLILVVPLLIQMDREHQINAHLESLQVQTSA